MHKKEGEEGSVSHHGKQHLLNDRTQKFSNKSRKKNNKGEIVKLTQKTQRQPKVLRVPPLEETSGEGKR